GVVASRIGLEKKAMGFSERFNFFRDISERHLAQPKLRCVLIDEAQFLKKFQVEQLARAVDELGLPVLCYGLRTDFLGEPFEGSQYLLAWADEMTEIKTICHCGRKANMNLRVDEDGHPVREGEQIEIGGNNRYIALCRKHFKNSSDASLKA